MAVELIQAIAEMNVLSSLDENQPKIAAARAQVHYNRNNTYGKILENHPKRILGTRIGAHSILSGLPIPCWSSEIVHLFILKKFAKYHYR